MSLSLRFIISYELHQWDTFAMLKYYLDFFHEA